MESLREVRRAMEREAEKGSCPLMFDRLEFEGNPFWPIMSEGKLDEILAWLLRVRGFRQYAGRTVINNVYMDLDMLCRKTHFRRARSVLEREGIYARVQRHKRRLQPDYGGRLFLETALCTFTLPEGEAERHRMVHGGQETYGFVMSDRYILGLFAHCEAARKSAASGSVECGHLPEWERGIALLESVRDVLFQALLLDDVEYGGNELTASLYTIHCLK